MTLETQAELQTHVLLDAYYLGNSSIEISNFYKSYSFNIKRSIYFFKRKYNDSSRNSV